MTVTLENRDKAISKANQLGWDLYNIRMISDHPDDHYLMSTLSKVRSGEWAVHLFNSNDEQFYDGWYTQDKTKAVERYQRG